MSIVNQDRYSSNMETNSGFMKLYLLLPENLLLNFQCSSQNQGVTRKSCSTPIIQLNLAYQGFWISSEQEYILLWHMQNQSSLSYRFSFIFQCSLRILLFKSDLELYISPNIRIIQLMLRAYDIHFQNPNIYIWFMKKLPTYYLYIQQMLNKIPKQGKVKSSLRLKSKTPLEKDEVHKINTILMHLNNQNDSIDFREPVDWQGLELYDYLEVIKHPMDLGTINQKLRDKKYKTVEAVLNDIQLIWDNCKLYNTKASDIYDIADKLQLSFRKMVKNYLPNLKVSTVTSVPIRPITQPPFTVVFKPERANEQRSTTTIKREFTEKIGNLSWQNLQKLINSIKQNCPQNFVETEDGWAKIELDSMQNTSFLKLNSFLNSLISASQPLLQQS